jgi:hypothetical protein
VVTELPREKTRLQLPDEKLRCRLRRCRLFDPPTVPEPPVISEVVGTDHFE